jgi:hypothetical protein
MLQNLISTRFRVTIGIVSIVMTLIFAGAPLIPDADKATMAGRVQLANTIALTSTRFALVSQRRHMAEALNGLVAAIESGDEAALAGRIREFERVAVVDIQQTQGALQPPVPRACQAPGNGRPAASVRPGPGLDPADRGIVPGERDS